MNTKLVNCTITIIISLVPRLYAFIIRATFEPLDIERAWEILSREWASETAIVYTPTHLFIVTAQHLELRSFSSGGPVLAKWQHTFDCRCASLTSIVHGH